MNDPFDDLPFDEDKLEDLPQIGQIEAEPATPIRDFLVDTFWVSDRVSTFELRVRNLITIACIAVVLVAHWYL